VRDHRVGGGVAGALALSHAVADHLTPAELHLLAVAGVVTLDLDHQIGVAQAHAIAGRRSVHLCVGATIDGLHASGLPSSRPMTSPGTPCTTRAPSWATRSTVRVCPGSKRTAVPAAMSSRNPRAAARSNSSAGLTSAK